MAAMSQRPDEHGKSPWLSPANSTGVGDPVERKQAGSVQMSCLFAMASGGGLVGLRPWSRQGHRRHSNDLVESGDNVAGRLRDGNDRCALWTRTVAVAMAMGHALGQWNDLVGCGTISLFPLSSSLSLFLHLFFLSMFPLRRLSAWARGMGTSQTNMRLYGLGTTQRSRAQARPGQGNDDEIRKAASLTRRMMERNVFVRIDKSVEETQNHKHKSGR